MTRALSGVPKYRVVIQLVPTMLGLSHVEIEVGRDGLAKFLQLERLRKRNHLSAVEIDLPMESLKVRWVSIVNNNAGIASQFVVHVRTAMGCGRTSLQAFLLVFRR